MSRIQIWVERFLPVILAVEGFWEEHPDTVQLRRVEHAADQSNLFDWELCRHDGHDVCQFPVPLNRGRVKDQKSSGAVSYHENLTSFPSVLTTYKIYIVNRSSNIVQLTEYGYLRCKPIFDGENKKSLLTEICAEIAVEFLIAHNQAASMDIDHNGKGSSLISREEYIQRVSLIAVSEVRDIPVLNDTIHNCRWY